MGLLDRLLGCYRPHPESNSTGTSTAEPNGNVRTTYGGYDPQLGWGSPHRMPESFTRNRWENLKSWTEPPAPVITALPTPHSPPAAAEIPATTAATEAWWYRPRGRNFPVWVPYSPPAGVHVADASHHPPPPSREYNPMYLEDGHLQGWLAPKPSYMRVDEYMAIVTLGMSRRAAPTTVAADTSETDDGSVSVEELPLPFLSGATPRRAQRLNEIPPQSFAGYR